MNRSSRLWSLAILCAMAAPAMAQDAASLGPQEGVLLLRNGRVLHGKIRRVGQQYQVATPTSEIRLPADDVEHACRTLDEGYAAKREALAADDIAGRLRLALWCIRQDLLGHAATELAAAMAIDPADARIQIVERRLEAARRPAPKAAPKADNADPTPSLEELDRMARNLPPGALKTYAATVQPILHNYCATSGCHGLQSPGKLRLLRGSGSRGQSRRATLRNLHATLACIDMERPDASPLLVKPTRPHANVDRPVFTDLDREQYEALAEWIRSVAHLPAEAEPPETVAFPNDPQLEQMRAAFAADGPTTAAQRRAPSAEFSLEQPTEGALAPAAFEEEIEHLTFPERHVQEPQPRPYTARDEFDPEVFNRRYHKEP